MRMVGSAGRLRRFRRALFTLLVGFVAAAQLASAQTPTPEQLETFQNLTPDQQRAVLEAMEGGDTATDSVQRPTEPTDETRRDRPQTTRGRDGRAAPGVPLSQGTVRGEARCHRRADRDARTRTCPICRRAAAYRGPARSDPARQSVRARRGGPAAAAVARARSARRPHRAGGGAAPQCRSAARELAVHGQVAAGGQGRRGSAASRSATSCSRRAPTASRPRRISRVGADYVVGPGDQINVDLFGKKTARYRLIVNRDGALTLPDLGPIQVTGLSFDEVREEIERRVAEQMIGVRASVTMGQLRSLRIFVVGDVVAARRVHRVSSLSTITDALVRQRRRCGVGLAAQHRAQAPRRDRRALRSLRPAVEGRYLARHARCSRATRSSSPPLGATAAVAGQVRRPAIYEFRDGATVGDLVELAGGLKAGCSARRSQAAADRAERRTHRRRSGSSPQPPTAARPLRAGDTLVVPKVLDEFAGGVTLEGHVQRPGPYAWRQGMRLTDLLGGLEMFKVNADQRYILIRREAHAGSPHRGRSRPTQSRRLPRAAAPRIRCCRVAIA